MKKRTYLRKDNDKGTVNNVIRFMVKDSRSVTDIQHHVNGIFGTNWDMGTIRKKMRDVQKSRPVPKPPVPPKNETVTSGRIPATITTKVKYKEKSIVALAKMQTSRTMPFGQLCEHIASFFEPISNAKKSQRKKMGAEWKLAKDKIELWNSMRQLLGTEKLNVLISQFTESESIAYSYCDRHFNVKNKKSLKSEWGGVHALYREWRAVYLGS